MVSARKIASILVAFWVAPVLGAEKSTATPEALKEKPVTAADYKTAPTADQMAQLQKIFAKGVCDWSKPGIGQDQKLTTWAMFKGDGTYVGL